MVAVDVQPVMEHRCDRRRAKQEHQRDAHRRDYAMKQRRGSFGGGSADDHVRCEKVVTISESSSSPWAKMAGRADLIGPVGPPPVGGPLAPSGRRQPCKCNKLRCAQAGCTDLIDSAPERR